MSYLIIGGLSPIALRGVIPQVLEAGETKKVVIYDDLSGGSSSSLPVLSDARVSVVVGSTFNEKLLQKVLTDNEITHVVDLASLSSPKEASPIAVARTAVVGFTHVLDAVRHYGGSPRFVLVSREPSASRPLSEDTPPLPNTLVAANAMAVESMLHSYVISYRLSLVIARLSEGVLAHDLSRGLNTAFTTAAASDILFSTISLKDAARGILAVLEKGVAPEIYNIGGQAAVSQSAVKECIEKIKAGSCCSLSSANPTTFPIERAQKELGWAPEQTNLCEVLKSEIAAVSATSGQTHSFTKVLIYGGDQTTGKKLIKAFEAKSITVVLGTAKPGENSIDVVKEELFRVAPSNIVFVGDRNEDPAYFDQEPKPARLRENVGSNLHAPWILAAICERVRCHFAYVQTHKEEFDQKTSEGAVKGFTKKLLEQFTSEYQTRFLLDETAVTDENLGAIVQRITSKNDASFKTEVPAESKTCALS